MDQDRLYTQCLGGVVERRAQRLSIFCSKQEASQSPFPESDQLHVSHVEGPVSYLISVTG